MGVDYSAVGGVGIYLSDEDFEQMGYKPDDDDRSEFLDNILGEIDFVNYSCYGSSYTGEIDFVLFVPGETIDEIYEYIEVFIDDLRSIGLVIERSNIGPIEEIYQW